MTYVNKLKIFEPKPNSGVTLIFGKLGPTKPESEPESEIFLDQILKFGNLSPNSRLRICQKRLNF